MQAFAVACAVSPSAIKDLSSAPFRNDAMRTWFACKVPWFCSTSPHQHQESPGCGAPRKHMIELLKDCEYLCKFVPILKGYSLLGVKICKVSLPLSALPDAMGGKRIRKATN